MKLGTTSAQKKLFFNLRKAKNRIGALEDGDLRPENVERIANDLGVTEEEVISMNRRLSGGDASLNAQIKTDGEGAAEWQDWLEDEDADRRTQNPMRVAVVAPVYVGGGDEQLKVVGRLILVVAQRALGQSSRLVPLDLLHALRAIESRF